MKAGKRMFSLCITDDTGEFTIEPVGEIDGKSFVEHLSFFYLGLQKKMPVLSMFPIMEGVEIFYFVPAR